MFAPLVSLLAVGAGLGTLLLPGSVAAMVPTKCGCIVISGGESAARTAFPGAGARVPGTAAKVPRAGARVGLLGAECYHLATEVLDTLQKCSAVGEWGYALKRWVGCGLGDAVRIVGRGV
jgi:hypothetical protein